MNNWIFVLGGRDTDKVLLHLLKKKNWGFWLNKHIRNKVEFLKKGDTIVFYVGGSKGKYFSGEAKLTSEPYKPDRESIGHPERGPLDIMVNFDNIDLWNSKKIYLTKEARNCLDFIKNKHNWGMTFGQSIVSITQKDYDDIKSIIV